MKRRDAMKAGALLKRHKLPIHEVNIGLAMQFLEEREKGETALSFQPWLDEEIEEEEDDGEGVEEATDLDEDGLPVVKKAPPKKV